MNHKAKTLLSTGTHALRSNKTDVILHAFDWEYADVAKQAHIINELGYKTVLVSPPMKSFKHSDGTKWWQRYQPQDYRVIDNQLGDTKTFAHMVKTLRAHNISVYADVVFNHMANESDRRDDLNYPNKDVQADYQNDAQRYQGLTMFGDLNEPLFTENDFVEAFGIEDWKDRWQVQNGRITGGPDDPGLPTLRDNEHVVKQQQNYLRALKKLGVRGFRIDAAKHMTLGHLIKVWTKDIIQDVHIFGEIITDGGISKDEYELFLEPYLECTKLGAYDFPLFNMVYGAFKEKGDMRTLIDPYCFGQALSNERAITFTITHDIPNNDVFLDLVMDEESEWLAYSYILGRDGGVPMVYSDLDTSGIMNKQGLPRWKDAWKDPRMAKMIAFHNLMHGQQMDYLLGGEEYLALSRGDKGIVMINKSEKPLHVNIDWSSNMLDLMTDQIWESHNGELELTLAPQSAQMLVVPELV